MLLRSATGAYSYVLTLYFQRVLELSPLETGLSFLPLAIASAATAPVAGRMVDSLGGLKPMMILGMVVQAAGLLLMALTLEAVT
jgi:MFS family permease